MEQNPECRITGYNSSIDKPDENICDQLTNDYSDKLKNCFANNKNTDQLHIDFKTANNNMKCNELYNTPDTVSPIKNDENKTILLNENIKIVSIIQQLNTLKENGLNSYTDSSAQVKITNITSTVTAATATYYCCCCSCL